jgi:hypothetical protein
MLKRGWLTHIAVAILAAVGSFVGTWALFSRQLSDQQAQISALSDALMAEATNLTPTAAIPQSQWRRLSDHQKGSLLAAFKAHKSELQDMVIYSMRYAETRQYAAQFVDVLREAGVTYHERQVPLTMSVDVGLVIPLVHSDQPPPKGAQTLMDILTAADLSVHFRNWHPINPNNADRPYGFFIGPMEWTGSSPRH